MKTAMLTAEGFQIREEAIPTCGDNQVLVKSAGCGICEGDVLRYVTRRTAPQAGPEVIRLGHEGSGVVVEVGGQVREFMTGDRVTALGGSYAEYFLAQPSQLALIPPGVATHRALGEPIACSLAAARRFGVCLGDRVAIIGAGYMGLSCLQLLKLQGAAEIVALDLLDWRLESARTFGADSVVNTRDTSPGDLAARLGEFDVVLEATGVEAAIDLATALLRNHGTLNLIGYHQSNGGIRRIDMKTWNYKALTVVNGHIRNEVEKLDAMKAALRLMGQGKLNTDALITDYPFTRIQQAFEDLQARKEGLYKANLVF